MEDRAPVLVAGGGTVGLFTALFLAHHGVPALTVERHAGTSIHPRALGIGLRSLELFREVGIDEEFRAAAVRSACAIPGSASCRRAGRRSGRTACARWSSR